MSAAKVLEIGPGRICDEDARDVLLLPGTAQPTSRNVHYARWGSEPLPIEDETYDLVVASHVLEHLPWWTVSDAMRESWRILRPGGVLVICVPDFAYLVKCYLDRTCGDKWTLGNRRRNAMTWLNGRIYGYSGMRGKGDDNWHHSCFDEASLTAEFSQAGFVDIVRLPDDTPYNRHGKINLGMQGARPA